MKTNNDFTDYTVEKTLTDISFFDPSFKPLLIDKAKEGARITTAMGCYWVKETPDQVRRYFGIAKPKFSLSQLILKWTGLQLILNKIYHRRGLLKAKDPELLDQIERDKRTRLNTHASTRDRFTQLARHNQGPPNVRFK